MANVSVPMPSVLKAAKKTNGDSVMVAASNSAALGDNEDSDESELEEDDDLLDDPDDVILQIDSEDEAELEAQRIRLDVKAAEAAAAAETAETTKKSQVGNGNKQKQQHQQQANNKAASRKPRGRPPGTGNKNKRNKSGGRNSRCSEASSASSLVAAEVLADEKWHRFFYKCSLCCNQYGDGLSLSRHFQKEHSVQDCHQAKRKRARSKFSSSGIESTPPLDMSSLNLGYLKPCAQLLIEGESLLQLCLACNSQFVDVKHFRRHLSEQHGYFKLLVPKEEPTEVPPTAMVTIPAAIAMSKSSPQFQLPVPAPDTPPPEQDGKDSSGTGSRNDKDDLEILNGMVAKMAAVRGKQNCDHKVNKIIIKVPGVAKHGKKVHDQAEYSKQTEKEQKRLDNLENPETKNQEKSEKAVQDPQQRPEEIDPAKRKRACKKLLPSSLDPEKNIKKEMESSERCMRKTRNFVDYVMDLKDEEDEGAEETEGSSATVSPRNSSSDESLFSIKRESIEESQSTGRLIHTCNFCGKTFQRFSRMQDHLRIHTGEKPFICNHCGRAFRLKMRLAEHKLRHRTEKAYQCEICSMPLATKQDLSLHMRHHKNDRRYKCDKCDKGFVRSSDLAIHVRIHTGEKPYACDLCGKAFRARQNLVVHRRTHLGDKPIQCELCEKRFARKIDMRVHMRKHTGEKPFNCESCQRGYSSRVNLQRHQQREHGKGSQNAVRKTTGQGKDIKEAGNDSIPQNETQSKTEPGTEPKEQEKPDLRRPRREQKISAQERLLNDLKRSFCSLPEIAGESCTGKNELDMAKFPTDIGAGCVPPAQVSVTVSLQVEAAANVEDDEKTPEKENAMSSGSQVDGKSKTNRKITSYFTVVGQQAETKT
ncbi:zinc finger protein 236 isoform X1 [Drosophila guanche]|uniref:Blast:Zinc finger protein 45 n=1 Tax=Drosophila guanche TaxID=7266 RepID=A0A3B0K6I5_DROGU|nr:zinc finger protein 236 isoform X1 [Drosophila guanche]SPP89734.1 blast:Zinc finger protein 45 [Drosophila guanche]